jgi:predicted RNA-binding Zn-ribbon protein involved in translation (DUF1610 family)
MSKAIVEAVEGASFGEAKLLCPNCGASHLHHGKTSVDGSHSVTIEFECEMCGPVQSLTISQHKGETYLSWETKP